MYISELKSIYWIGPGGKKSLYIAYTNKISF